jgi:DNA-binding LacI/PurR family transcriptional regulator
MSLPGHALLWGQTPGGQAKEAQAWQLCRHFMERRVSGVFFAPLEHAAERAEMNLRITSALHEAGIPVVLLDRDIEPYPVRSRFDLVSLDNRGAGRDAACHLIRSGRQRIGFVHKPGSAPSVAARKAGYRDALLSRGWLVEAGLEGEFDPLAREQVLDFIRAAQPDALVCANDRTAAELMQTLSEAGVAIPGDVALVGVDDVSYAGLLPVPLTTVRQPCRAIGQVALSTMIERLRDPQLPAREVLLQGELVVRQSCGFMIANLANLV